ncbi:MAG: TonB-dependent receptor plug domain-containing protein, partial [Novosphingobium sp.]
MKIKGNISSLLLAGVAAAALLSPGYAFAADAADQAQADVSTDNSVNEIIVTANRREERAQDVPISITAISANNLRERNISNLQDLQGSVPSLIVAPNGQATRDVMSPSIRGQSAT